MRESDDPFVEALERRALLSGGPAEMLLTLPVAPANANDRFYDFAEVSVPFEFWKRSAKGAWAGSIGPSNENPLGASLGIRVLRSLEQAGDKHGSGCTVSASFSSQS